MHDCLESSKVLATRTDQGAKIRIRRCTICRNQWKTIEIMQGSYEKALEMLSETAKTIGYVLEL